MTETANSLPSEMPPRDEAVAQTVRTAVETIAVPLSAYEREDINPEDWGKPAHEQHSRTLGFTARNIAW